MADEGEETRDIPGYAVAELLRALASSSELAHRRAAEWRRLLTGILDGTLKIGSRTPVKDTPVSKLAAEGESFDAEGRHPSGARRFLGWSLGRHWLMPPE